jgi:hypothetical protein
MRPSAGGWQPQAHPKERGRYYKVATSGGVDTAQHNQKHLHQAKDNTHEKQVVQVNLAIFSTRLLQL